MHARGHARRVCVPVQEVERERVLAHQVVVDDERPDEVVGAQQVEGACHLGALEIAALVHLLLEIGNLLLVDKYAQLSRLREVEQADEVGGGLHTVIALGREIPQCRPQEGAAEAIADDVNLALAGGTCDGVQCGERTLDHVIVEALLR